MRYPGGKGKTYQHIINLMPPHRVYIETHLGGGAVMRNKKPARRNIGIDLDKSCLTAWPAPVNSSLELVNSRAEDFLKNYTFQGDELVYVDPPYLPSTRRKEHIYRHEYTESDHQNLLRILVKLPCNVLISGYESHLYNEVLSGWNRQSFSAKTHTDVRMETVWFNYARPTRLHDSQHLGHTFRDREQVRRKLNRLKGKIEEMDPLVRSALLDWLSDRFPREGVTA